MCCNTERDCWNLEENYRNHLVYSLNKFIKNYGPVLYFSLFTKACTEIKKIIEK